MRDDQRGKKTCGRGKACGEKDQGERWQEGKGREGGESPVRTVICTGVGLQFQKMTAVHNHREEVGNHPTTHLELMLK